MRNCTSSTAPLCVLSLSMFGIAIVDSLTIKPYWKFEGSHEIASTLGPIGAPDDTYEAMARGLASGWAEHTDDDVARWTIWNRGTGEFIAPTVRWAHLELIRR